MGAERGEPAAPAPGESLRSDCARCTGLCCVALRFERSADFAFDKAEGERCRHLTADHGCGVHDRLPALGMRGCTVFECFGAGQQVTQVTFAGRPPDRDDDGGAARFGAFAVLRAVQEMRWLLSEGNPTASDPGCLELGARLTAIAAADEAALRRVDLGELRREVGDRLRALSRGLRSSDGPELAGADLVGRDLRRRRLRDADLRGALLVAADLRGVDLARADLLGADLRDADLRGADASAALFLTQPQVQAARGDAATRLPGGLTRPAAWG